MNRETAGLRFYEVRAWYDLGRCREAQADRDGAREYYERFLSHWTTPDHAFPEIADALRRYESLTGETWGE